MTKTAIQRRFAPGQVVSVTNHFINRPDHPCFGTRERTIAKVTSSHLHFTETRHVPWPKAEHLTVDGNTVQFWGFPKPNDLFLTINLSADGSDR